MRNRHRTPIALIAITLIFLTACGTTKTTPPPTATQLLQTASDHFTNDSAMHFHLTASNIAPGLYAVTDAQGDVVRPDKLAAQGSVEVTKGLNAGIGVVFIGQDQYLALGGSAYTKSTLLPNLLLIFDPNQGIGAILKQVANPSTPVADTVQNLAVWKITGTVPSTTLAPFTGSTSTQSTPIQTTLWIGQSDGQIHQVLLVGQAADGDNPQSTRTIVLSNFNEQVTITAPLA